MSFARFTAAAGRRIWAQTLLAARHPLDITPNQRRRKGSPGQFRLAVVIDDGIDSQSESDSAASCGVVRVSRVRLIEATYPELLGTKPLNYTQLNGAEHFAAASVIKPVSVGDVVYCAWWNNRYWIDDVLVEACGESSSGSSSFSESSSYSNSESSSYSNSASESESGSESGSTPPSESGSGSGSSASSDSGIPVCGTCSNVPRTLTVNFNCTGYQNFPVSEGMDCETELQVYYNAVTGEFFGGDDTTSFGGVSSGNCNRLDGTYRMHARILACRNVILRRVRYDFASTPPTEILEGSTFFSPSFPQPLPNSCDPFSISRAGHIMYGNESWLGTVTVSE